MYIVTVLFEVKESKITDFHHALLLQAKNSLAKEKDCHQFDVCVDPVSKNRFFLYEVYSKESAFLHHLKSEHFLQFDELVKCWLISKDVGTWEKLA